MELIIKIDDDIVKGIRGENDCKVEPREIVRSFQATIAEAITNGTPYNPSGDLISRSVVKNLVSDKSIPIKFEKEKRGDWQYSIGVLLSNIYKAIDNAPTVDISENEYFPGRSAYFNGVADGRATARPKGEWVYHEEPDYSTEDDCIVYYQCSVCGRKIYSSTVNEKDYPFCHCGADMRGEENETQDKPQ